MKHDDQHQFLNEVLGGESWEACRQTTLENGLSALRRKRRSRRGIQACVLTCLPLVAALLFLFLRETSPAKRITRSPTQSQTSAGLADPKLAVKIINDDELFALFPNRPMALVGKPGRQQVVFLDRSGTSHETVTQ